MKLLVLLIFSVFLLSATNTTFNPNHVSDLNKADVTFNGMKVSGVAAANTTTNIDMTLTDDHLITGAALKASGACEADEVKFQVVSGATVVNTFIDWFLLNGLMEKDLLYPAKIPAGLKLRVAYKNTCSSSVNVYVNYFLHKVLQ